MISRRNPCGGRVTRPQDLDRDCRILHHVIVVQPEETGARLPSSMQFVTAAVVTTSKGRRAAQEDSVSTPKSRAQWCAVRTDAGNEFSPVRCRPLLQPGGVDSAIAKPLPHQRLFPEPGGETTSVRVPPAGVEQVQEGRGRARDRPYRIAR